VKLAALAVSLCLAFGGCSDTAQRVTPRETPEDRPSACEGTGPVGTATPRPDRGDATPPIALLDGSCGEIQGALGTYCWSHGGKGICSDAISPVPPTHRLVVLGSEELRLSWRTKSDPDDVVVALIDERSEERREIEAEKTNPTSLLLDAEPGRYVLEVGTWIGEGDAAYTFGIRVVDG